MLELNGRILSGGRGIPVLVRVASALLVHTRMRRILVVIGAVTLLGACAGPEPVPRGLALEESFDVAAARTGVPADLLRAIAIHETGLRPGASPDDGHGPPSLGVLALRPTARRDQIALAESLLLVDREQIAADPGLGVLAGAEVLAAEGDEARQAPHDLADWIAVASSESGLPEGAATRRYAAELARTLRRGARANAPDGSVVVIEPQDVPPPDGVGAHEYAVAEYPEAEWSPASGENYTSGRGGNAIDLVVVHTVQGSYNGCISWFANPAASASTHFVVRSADGAVTQMVEEGDTGWHAGNWGYNQRSIGIEHEGFVDDPGTWYTDSMYAGSAALVRYLVDKYGIPLDRNHIIGHDEVPDPDDPGQFGGAGNHTDPGSGWDWDLYMGMIEDLGGGGRPDYGAELVARDFPAEMTSGERVVAWVDLTNTGRRTWGLASTFLASQDDPAPLHDAENWITPLRASGPDHSTYSAGTVGRFTFMIHAPEVTEDTHVVQRFALEEEGVGRFGPAEDILFEILVHPSGGGGSDGDADPDDDPEPDGDPDDPGADPGADPEADPGRAAYAGTADAGCRAVPGRSAPEAVVLFVLLGAFLGARRRGARR